MLGIIASLTKGNLALATTVSVPMRLAMAVRLSCGSMGSHTRSPWRADGFVRYVGLMLMTGFLAASLNGRTNEGKSATEITCGGEMAAVEWRS